ncbi:MAG: glycoside hydrolase family 31 protein [Bacteroidetes bacterium]|nr:glycoside hydrolase family 31 protein [Bacteroidota bacterium]
MCRTNTKFLLIILLFSIGFQQFSCTQASDSEINTKILENLEFEESEEYVGWEIEPYYTGTSLTEKEVEGFSENYIRFEIYTEKPGRYYVWVLAAQSGNSETSQKSLEVELVPLKSTVRTPVVKKELFIPSTKALEWTNELTQNQGKLSIDLPVKGIYFLTFKVNGDKTSKLFLDKFVIADNSHFSPKGYELEIEPDSIVLPPAWAFGVLYGGNTDQNETKEVINQLIANDFPIDGYWIDSWFWDYSNKGEGPGGYTNFTGDTIAFPDQRELWNFMKEKNIKSGIWIWNAIQKDGNEAVFNDFYKNDFFEGEPFIYTNEWLKERNNSLTGNINFDNEEAALYWKNKMKPLFDKGLDFLKLDGKSDIPFVKTSFEATQTLGKESHGRGFILAHLYEIDQPEVVHYPTRRTANSQKVWTQAEDPDDNFGTEGGFLENVGMVVNPKKSTYQVPFLTHDAAGSDYSGPIDQEEELYKRWMQFSLFNPITTVFSNSTNPKANLPFRYSKEVMENVRYYAHLKMQLFPYIYAYAHRSRIDGKKMIRGDEKHTQQYLFGDEILIAPITKPNLTSLSVSLPNGNWFDYYSNEVFEGGQQLEYFLKDDQLPLFIREAGFIPMRAYGGSIEKGSNDLLILQIYPGYAENGTFELIEDDGISNAYLKGIVAKSRFSFIQKKNKITVTIHPTEGTFEGMKETRNYQFVFNGIEKPASVKINRKSLDQSLWKYDQASRKLSFPTDGINKKESLKIDLKF